MPTLTNDGLLAVSGLLGVQTLPTVLAVGPQQDSADAWRAAQQQAIVDLRGAGLIDGYDEVESDLATALHVLAQPERELVARIYTESGPIRICLVRRGFEHALAIRTGGDIDIRTTWADGDGTALARPIVAALGACEPAAIAHFSALAQDLRTLFDSATTSTDFTQALYSLGVVGEREAIEFGLAMSTCFAHAEITAHATSDAVTTRALGSVAIYDTARGRIVASPGAAQDLRVWATFTPGSDHRIAQAISALIDSLPGGGWMP
ncbi:ESX secretion-associated protein EspG [Nocardia sp. NPDC052254]|uniref:ESX secretion-associated protein EspG n=1 Tax=Nocardia sp. NPDC052254 TaxID=3155681 RepID=UPI0034263202